MPDALTESFCERCGTRYELAAPARLTPIRRTRGLISGLKNFVMSQDSLADAVGDAMHSQSEALAVVQLDAFHASFNFCIECRQYTCGKCWNEAERRCQSCQPLPGQTSLEPIVGDLQWEPDLASHSAEASVEVDPRDRSAWPASDLTEAPLAAPETVWVDPEWEPVRTWLTAEPEVAIEPEPAVAAASDGEPWLDVLADAEDEPEPEVPAAVDLPWDAVAPTREGEPDLPVAAELEAAPELMPEPEPMWGEPDTTSEPEVAAEPVFMEAEGELQAIAEVEAPAEAEAEPEFAEPLFEFAADQVEPEAGPAPVAAEIEEEPAVAPEEEVVAAAEIEEEPAVAAEAEEAAWVAAEADVEPLAAVDAEAEIEDEPTAAAADADADEDEEAWAAAEAEVEPLAAIDAEPAPEAEVEPLAAGEIEPAAEVEVEPLAAVEQEPAAAEADVERLAAVEAEPAPAAGLTYLYDTFLHDAAPTRPEGETAPPAAGGEALAARRTQLELLGLGDQGQRSVDKARPTLLPNRSAAAAAKGQSSAADADAGGAFWDASAREVASAISQVGVRTCGHCDLPLSATARFCRRCGMPQARSA